MARAYRPPSAHSHQGGCATSLARGGRPRALRKEARPLRRSARLQQRRTSQSIPALLSAPGNNGPDSPPADQKRKCSCETDTSDRAVHKRQRPSSTATEDIREQAASGSEDGSPIDYWRKYQRWPRTLFESSGTMDLPLARKKSTSTLRRKSSATSISSSGKTPSDSTSRENKGSIYRDKRFDGLLAAHKSFPKKDGLGVASQSKVLCNKLLEAEQPVLQDSLFNDDLFEKTCDYLVNRSEAMVIREIGLLIVPSAAHFARRGAKHLEILAETVNESWSESIPLFKPRPHPDYSVGFDSSAFSEERIKRLKPFVGTLWDESYFAATWYMYFPFLTCEVKCGAAALDIADRQNAHSATLAVRAVVELFRLVKREKELDREILAFSVSHDHSNVRIYGHYPVIDGKDTKYYRYPIHKFDFTIMGGKDKWTTYKFIKNVYDNWMPDHFKRICSAIDAIPPDISFDVSQEPELQFSQTGLSQDLESQRLSQLEGSASVAGHGSVSTNADGTTPDTSVSQNFKKPRRL
ncbi:hypothetical protein B0J12DRAFT_349532 [Macrophomina phaseolina]|uniref:DUF7924 domain-containing protein n=1 Tax=Macrophomina phaseolina TaxID=35725 RepID=A0ABQ8GQD3_9PEZI|nr:hypothetical protein B0J12DRAFT_349532 [Macrophomina phaseolina]